MDIWRGNVVGATDRPNEVKAATGNAFVSWLLPLLASSLAVGLFLSSTSASAMSSVNTVMGGYMSGPTFGDWFKTFFIVSIVFFGFMMLRALAVLLAARVSGSQASFNDSASALGVGQTLWWLPLVIATVLFLIVPELAVLFLVPVILAMPVMSEIATYVGLTRLGNHKRSPLVPYAWFSALASIIMMLIFYSYIRNAFLSQMPF